MKDYFPVRTIRFSFILLFSAVLFSCERPASELYFESTGYNKDWEFTMDASGYLTPEEADSAFAGNWESVSLPHTPRTEPLVVNDQWQGVCWYRKNIPYRQEWKGKHLFLRFEGAMNTAEVWLNGNKQIRHDGGYLPFVVELNDLSEDSANILYVRLDNRDNPVTGPKPLHLLDFNMYGGIYRNVTLQVKNDIYISDEQFEDREAGGGIFVTFPEVSKEHSRIEVRSHIRNRGNENRPVTLIQELKREGKTFARSTMKKEVNAEGDLTFFQELSIENAELWSPASPVLYRLISSAYSEGRLVDRKITRVGIRKYEFRDNRLFINDEEAFLRGVNRHQEYPYVGYALSDRANYRDAYKIKAAGFNLVRTSHYPQSPAFLDACDELGIVVVDAILGWQYYNDDNAFRQHVYRTCRDLVRRDRNHPSVLAWEVSLNESWMPEDFIDTLVQVTRSEFPFGTCYTAGWQTYGYDIYIQARQHRLGHEEILPDKPYMVSEYGDWEYFAMNAGLNQEEWGDLLPSERSSRQALGSGEKRLLQQALNIQEAHNDNLKTSAFADAYWVMFDYNRGYSGDLEESGIMNIFRLPKFSYYFFRSQRDVGESMAGEQAGPELFIASYLDSQSGSEIELFTNCDETELFINDISQGTRGPETNRVSDRLRHPPVIYKGITGLPAEVKVVGRVEGKDVKTIHVPIAGQPSKIVLEPDLSGKQLAAGENDLIFVYAHIVDERGCRMVRYTEPVRFRVEGPATIIGPDSVLPEAGTAVILIKAGSDAGLITIGVSSGKLEAAELSLNSI